MPTKDDEIEKAEKSKADKRRKRQLARKRLRRLKALKKYHELQGNGAGPSTRSPKAAVPPPPPAPAIEKTVTMRSPGEIRERKAEIEALERDVAELSQLSSPSHDNATDLKRLRNQVKELRQDFYANLGPWQRVQLARHPNRPYTEDFIRLLFENFSEIHGDRNFADDTAMVTGMAWYQGQPVMVIGTQKGRDTKQRVARNFGQSMPEGYRKALRAMNLAAKFSRPVMVFIDTPGAFPGIGAEERGQAEAIAHNLREMSRLPVPIIVTVTGEAGSGGALGIGVGDRVFMLENTIYSVISPEGCASIMWRDSTKAEVAAEALKITSHDLLDMKLIDEIVPEPDGGAHNDYAAAAKLLEPFLTKSLNALMKVPAKQLVDARYEKLRRMGQFFA